MHLHIYSCIYWCIIVGVTCCRETHPSSIRSLWVVHKLHHRPSRLNQPIQLSLIELVIWLDSDPTVQTGVSTCTSRKKEKGPVNSTKSSGSNLAQKVKGHTIRTQKVDRNGRHAKYKPVTYFFTTAVRRWTDTERPRKGFLWHCESAFGSEGEYVKKEYFISILNNSFQLVPYNCTDTVITYQNTLNALHTVLLRWLLSTCWKTRPCANACDCITFGLRVLESVNCQTCSTLCWCHKVIKVKVKC